MIILQVLNNNVLLVEDGADKEQIIWGKGIGFKARKGQDYHPQQTDHIFLPVSRDDDEWVNSFKELSTEIPRAYFELTDQIINVAQKDIETNFDGHLLLPLTDHIYFAVLRVQKGMNLSNPMLFDIKRFFHKEFQVGKKALDMIHELSGVSLAEDEAGFIAMHLIEHEISQSDNSFTSVNDCLDILSKINEILKDEFNRNFSDSSVAVSRMTTHIYYLLLRSHSKRTSKNNACDSDLLARLIKQYPKAGSSLTRIVPYLENSVDYKFNDSDRLFLLIHIIHITE